MTPTSILLLPTAEHREALLGDSPGGGRVPTACLYRSLDDESLQWGLTGVMLDTPALVLRWRGEDDPMGIERLFHVMRARPTVYAGLESVLGAFAVERFGRVIYLDADGREVSP